MRFMAWGGLLLALAALGGCGDDGGSGDDGGVDGGPRDGGMDGGSPRDGATDAGDDDAGGPEDGGGADGAPADGGPDGAPADGGPRDGGPRDGGRDGAPPDAARDAGVPDGVRCVGAPMDGCDVGEYCCAGTETSCYSPPTLCPGDVLTCDGSEDCPGQRCCQIDRETRCADLCVVRICHTDDDCAERATCCPIGGAPPFGALSHCVILPPGSPCP